MVGYSGSLVLLKIENEPIGGMRATRFLLNNQIVDVTNKESAGWRDLLGGAGTSSISITGAGVFTDSKSEQLVRLLAFEHRKQNFTLVFGNGDKLIGAFIISTYERSGAVSEEEVYNISLESSGKVIYHSRAASDLVLS